MVQWLPSLNSHCELISHSNGNLHYNKLNMLRRKRDRPGGSTTLMENEIFQQMKYFELFSERIMNIVKSNFQLFNFVEDIIKFSIFFLAKRWLVWLLILKVNSSDTFLFENIYNFVNRIKGIKFSIPKLREDKI